MSVPVFYGSIEDNEEAERVAQAIRERSNFNSFSVESSDVDWGSFDGIVIVGGQKASEVYNEAVQKTGLTKPTQSNQLRDRTC